MRPSTKARIGRRAGFALAAFLVSIPVSIGALVLLPGDVEYVPPPAPRVLDLCADRRPDGTLPASCAGSPDDGAMTLVFAGDTALADAALPSLNALGFDYPFSATRDLIATPDVAIANFEAPITDSDEPFPRWKEYVYRAPLDAAPALARAGFDVVGLANNHVIDYQARGLLDTRRALEQAKLVAIGAGVDEAEARRGVIVRGRGVAVGILARCEHKLDWDLWVGQYAVGSKPGVANLVGHPRALAEDVAALRSAGADVVVLFVHWGPDYSSPSWSQRRLAREVAESGVDLVVGHHPHVSQPVMMAGRTPIALSLGNYAFGTPGRPSLDFGVLLRAEVRGRKLRRLELRPIDVQNRRVDFRPVPLAADRARAALAPLVEASRELGADLRVDGDRAVLDLPEPR